MRPAMRFVERLLPESLSVRLGNSGRIVRPTYLTIGLVRFGQPNVKIEPTISSGMTLKRPSTTTTNMTMTQHINRNSKRVKSVLRRQILSSQANRI
jgi:hypothetical protein